MYRVEHLQQIVIIIYNLIFGFACSLFRVQYVDFIHILKIYFVICYRLEKNVLEI